MTIRETLMLFCSVGLIGCGAAPPPDGAAPSADPKTPGTEPGAPAGGGAAAPSMEELQQAFIGGCTKKLPEAAEYCECSWEQMQTSFSLEEMRSKNDDPARMDAFRNKVVAACGEKMPEAQLKSGFIRACAAEGQELEAYCDCSWVAYRKKLSKAEMADQRILQSEKFKQIRKDAVKTCAPTLPEKVAQAGFMRGCTKTDAHKPFCDCAWKAIRKDNSAAEIQSGLVDLEAMRSKIKASCEKFKPSKG
jgi:hypothetical protein